MTRLSRNLVALLSYGGVSNDFFSNILLKTLAESQTIFYNERAAFRGTKKTQSFLVRLQFLYAPETTELTNLRRCEVFKMIGSLRRHLMGLL